MPSCEFIWPVWYLTAHSYIHGWEYVIMNWTNPTLLALILRLNDAPVREYKKDVGERTSIRLFFPESALPNPLENNDNDTLMVFVPFKPSDFLWLREVLLKTRNKVRSL